jgi:hypothetical protein
MANMNINRPILRKFCRVWISFTLIPFRICSQSLERVDIFLIPRT